ncbi:hypothetical protein FZI85_27370 [Mycobacterium sp. CBMA293]|uniref:Uncharacterized protein n=1 Tax=Mycolicibacterium sp. CBMA 213 TaxID=1968788 RepID=A0A1S6GKN9_9MYCO|nr:MULTISPECIES: hypothetical protein [unclassified Mycolicibacterium]AQS22412.1 hypothetical protein pCBMA213_2_00048 [Mycolicibacterium sp. CBMA 213]MUL48469.1 hypothetical protein [Mycolicibacterium sp. CBMA 360]MUL62327.1 hypothetical protein [Mycolicibacterium sp. CBMA 335]MUM04464.1 hypothetical protein [Mycolicibacterium sp. CBMA 213]MUM14727.1 hypothetical protein [Mycolicibacterium sp. CBMA 293]
MTPPAATEVIPAVDVSVHLPVLLLGLRWLFDTEQPDTAIVAHDGQAVVSAGGRTLRFIPRGRVGSATICVEVTSRGTDHKPVTADELDAFAALLADIDVRVQHTWVEYPGDRGCLALLRPAHASLCEATARYDRGCPRHRHPHWCVCGWYADGAAALIGLTELHQQVSQWAESTPTLAGPWPTHLDPKGVLSQIAATAARSRKLVSGAVPLQV